jgi:prepilin-type N-terminal cleavage/methylation domain-containing protein
MTRNHLAIWRSGDLAINCRQPRRGFSLIELMIVVAVIAVMLGLTLAVAVGLAGQNDARETQNVLTLMDKALSEWELATEKRITYGTNLPAPNPHYVSETFDFDTLGYAITPNAKPSAQWLNRDVVSMLLRNPQAADQLSQISSELFTRNAKGEPQIFDPWGQKIQIVFPGRKWRAPGGAVNPNMPADPANKRDLDGTFRTDYEERFGICTNSRMLFVSFGPDKKGGDLELSKAPDARDPRNIAPAADNIYSYPALMETPQYSGAGP